MPSQFASPLILKALPIRQLLGGPGWVGDWPHLDALAQETIS